MQALIFFSPPEMTPLAIDFSSASVRPSVFSLGWFSNSAVLKEKKSFGEYSATQAAAFEARSEYCVPSERLLSVARGGPCRSRRRPRASP